MMTFVFVPKKFSESIYIIQTKKKNKNKNKKQKGKKNETKTYAFFSVLLLQFILFSMFASKKKQQQSQTFIVF